MTTPKAPAMREEFDPDQVIIAIEHFLDYGEQTYQKGQHDGYFSGNGWAARVLRFHHKQLNEQSKNT
jgi:hypothetical protein